LVTSQSTVASLIILFSGYVEIFKIFFFLKENKKSDEIFENISFVEMDSSKLINHLTMFLTIHSLHQKWNQQRAACPTYQTPKTGCE
jgi:hypothetical protein